MPRTPQDSPGSSRLQASREHTAVEVRFSDDSEDDVDRAFDGPRIAQWEDDPDDFLSAKPEQSVSSSLSFTTRLNSHKPSRHHFKDDENSSRASGNEDSDMDASSSHGETSRQLPGERKEAIHEGERRLSKRANKHAPTEISSKRPVSRRRTVVDVKSAQSRDPRFLPLSGEYSTHSFHSNYAFINDLHKTELDTLRDSLKRARKLLRNSPKEVLAEREEEVERLALAVKRAESAVNRDRREQIEREALERVKQDEKEKRKHGKKEWHISSSEKKDLLIHARHDAIVASGGRQAIKKAIEKRQKKLAQKEKKSRPNIPANTHFQPGDPSSRKRRRVG